MATITATPTTYKPFHNEYVWTSLTENDTAAAVEFPGNGDKTVQVTGTFGGATVVLQGSLDGSNWATLKDGAGTAISFTSAGLASVLENVAYVRPSASGGTSQSLTVRLFVAK